MVFFGCDQRISKTLEKLKNTENGNVTKSSPPSFFFGFWVPVLISGSSNGGLDMYFADFLDVEGVWDASNKGT